MPALFNIIIILMNFGIEIDEILLFESNMQRK
jgi:hypothetical protein